MPTTPRRPPSDRSSLRERRCAPPRRGRHKCGSNSQYCSGKSARTWPADADDAFSHSARAVPRFTNPQECASTERNICEPSGSSSVSHHSCGSVDSVTESSKAPSILLFAVFANEAIQRTLQELGGFPRGTFPIGRVRDAEIDKDGGKTRRGRSRCRTNSGEAGRWSRRGTSKLCPRAISQGGQAPTAS